MAERYDAVLVGSGFASIFFLRRALESGRVGRVLLLDRGRMHGWEWQATHRRNRERDDEPWRHYISAGEQRKPWGFNIGVGGGSNCWWANIMRFHPHDFELRSRYGIGRDWPLGYAELEPYYAEIEAAMQVSGDPASASLFPRSTPFPQPRHRFSRPAAAFAKRYPEHFFAMPQARARIATEHRNPCCANSMCSQCPVNAKFMIVNDMADLLADQRVTLRAEARVDEIVTAGGRATGVRGQMRDGTPFEAEGETVVLGANGIFNPHLLLRSGIADGPVGLGLHEQLSVDVDVLLDGMEDGDGSSHLTGVGYTEIHGEFRRHAAGGFFETQNLPYLRPHATRYRELVRITFMLEELREDRNRVELSPERPETPVVRFEGWSDYVTAGARRIEERLPDLLAALPVEDVIVGHGRERSHAHIQGTTVMGTDPERSVIDPGLVHHRLRNLIVLGSGAFPTGGWANPTLTLSALAARSAHRYYGRA